MRVFLLRSRGHALSRRDVNNGPTYVGEVCLGGVYVAGTERREAVTLTTGGGRPDNVVPPLLEPKLINILADGFCLRGYERVDAGNGPYLVIQEWKCLLLNAGGGRYDKPWHPAIMKDRKQRGEPMERDPAT